MKRLISAAAAALLCAAFCAQPGYAGVSGSRHDAKDSNMPAAKYGATMGVFARWGTCSPCHFPHNAATGGAKLFPEIVTAAKGEYFAPLCLRCHDSTKINDPDAYIDDTVMATNSHGFNTANLTARTTLPLDLGGSTLPYVNVDPATGGTNQRIQCLSCHDVHNQRSLRPFLEISLDTLCQNCHGTSRDNNAQMGWGNTTSTHPAGINVIGDRAGMTGVAGDSPIVLTGGELVQNTMPAGGSVWAGSLPAWNSGMQLYGQGAAGGPTSGVTCITCHNVHFDEDDGANADNGTLYLAMVDDNYNWLTSTAADATANWFCEYCHRGDRVVPAGYDPASTSPSTSFWNPGRAASYSHPNDNVGGMDTTLDERVDFPGGLSYGGWFPGGIDSPMSGTGRAGVVCTSCHGVHVTFSGAPQTEPSTPILINFRTGNAAGLPATRYGNFCGGCHTPASTSAPTGFTTQHHPVGAGVYATAGNNAGGVTCIGGDLAAGLGQCHGAPSGPGGVVAHNRTTGFTNPATNASGTCVACHSPNPSTYSVQEAPNPETYTAGELASHFIGDAAAQTYFKGRTTDAGTGAIRYAGTASAPVGGGEGATAWPRSGLASRFGANESTIICESCHRLADGNLISGDGATSLLVTDAGAVPVIGNNYLCYGCHLRPSGTHPLDEANNPAYAAGAGADGQSFTGASPSPGVNMNCDSCHSAHNADTSSGNFILDSPVTTTNASPTGMEWEPPIDYTDFCAVCHGTFR